VNSDAGHGDFALLNPYTEVFLSSFCSSFHHLHPQLYRGNPIYPAPGETYIERKPCRDLQTARLRKALVIIEIREEE
jgi:hypothetical protein